MALERFVRWLGSRGPLALRALWQCRHWVDFTQANRRMRRAWQSGRDARFAYLTVQHQRRRLRRRAEIQALVEGPVAR